MRHFYSPRCYLFLLLVSFSPIISLSQFKATYAGLHLISEFESSLDNKTFGLGVSIERQFTKHSGIESGIYYRTYIYRQTIIANTTVLPFSVSEKYISIPLLYKFYSKFVNVSIGPSVDYFAGWKQKDGTDGLKVNSHSVDPNFAFGIMAEVGKPFPLSKQLFIEPVFRFNHIFPTLRDYLGICVSIKCKL